jgi:hypothetical protein
MAQARLGIVGGRLEGLVADAIEGLPVPSWSVSEGETTWEGEPPAEPSVGWAVPATPTPSPALLSRSAPLNTSSPPSGDCSTSNAFPPNCPPQTSLASSPNSITDSTSANSTTMKSQPQSASKLASQPLLTTAGALPVTQLQLGPNTPVAAFTQPNLPRPFVP